MINILDMALIRDICLSKNKKTVINSWKWKLDIVNILLYYHEERMFKNIGLYKYRLG